ncbi:SagB/ThcOx family dehydrogenase [Methylocella silvestris]|uniref:Nitroreductase n=1 Tax=Methylocella silvestris TaxID=199596 RepID=A0A2J7TBW0_METSI|nr:SagB/ThcOx family dehydrogenase [Methylocella silvestris]PNG24246.1 nitroreductase [Methylocella silvestris]
MNFSRDQMPIDIRGYHQRTKHASNRYALGPAFLDWSSQPSPYRLFAESPQIVLPLIESADASPFPGPALRSAPVDRDAIALFLELAFGLSAWKSAEGSTWALRNNPSSGNLHPSEAYVLLDAAPGVGESAALYHYAPLAHALETRAIYEADRMLPAEGFLLGLTSIPWREAWKYGERAFRYCQLDAGHAIGAAAQAAAALGWRAEILPEVSDDQLDTLLGLSRPDAWHRREVEHADLLLWISGDGAAPATLDLKSLADAPRTWHGRANRVSEDHDGWPLVDLAVQFCRKPRSAAIVPAAPRYPLPPVAGVSTEACVRGRRSAQRMDGATAISRGSFAAMLAATLPGAAPLLDGFVWPPAITLVIFVHRVDGIEPGLYVLGRDEHIAARLRASASRQFDWSPVDLDSLPLYRLRADPVEREATRLSCLQGIAGKGCFSVAMIAEFDAALDAEGAFAYRRLHWEAGLIGQAFYLWASALGVAGTGIGCFFDDEVHSLLGLAPASTQFQDIYHFTVGAAVEDARILTLPPYPRERWIRR